MRVMFCCCLKSLFMLFALSILIPDREGLAKVFVAQENHIVAEVVKILDGDSIVVNREGEMIQVRLWGIDAPEYNQRYSLEASSCLRNILLLKTIRIIPLYIDSYKRLVGHVFLNDLDINQLLVERGLAWVHPYFCNKPICTNWNKLQQKAQSKSLNLWKEDEPIAPWKWKRKYLKGKKT